MSWTTTRRAALALLAVVPLAVSSTATAVTTTLEPSPAEARTFATTNGGWSSAVDYGNLVCIPGVTCPTANPSYRSSGGSGGAADGHLRSTFGTLLGVLATTTISWTSPTFVAPSSTDTATLRFSIRPQIASLLAIGSVNVRASIVDVADDTKTTVLPTIPLTAASASFAVRSVDVPVSAVAAGRTYRVRIATSATNNVSAVTSGNVDLDDVELELNDLDLPTDLTASVPTTGAARVTGSVDPLGTETEVTVDYGLTTAYGSTTTAVPVSGTGPQPFTIPLTDLTPGATYNYRVTATNSDGSVSTENATFVAPSGPDNPVPTVTGADNAATRTVTFTRGSDVTSASVELLDDEDELLETFPDTDDDGSVTVTLPADGRYGVRVVRANAEGQSSTSAIVPLTLDRVAPDVSNLEISVTPEISNVLTRTVSFTRPADATTVVAQLIDANDVPVGLPATLTGSSATLVVGPADGDYRVRLTLTDAAGNAADGTSDTVTLDRVAPDAGPAPTVTGDGNSRQRTVAFTRDPSAATVVVEILDADAELLDTVPVATGGSAEITLPDADATYGVRVRQTDAAGNGAATEITDTALDRVAPDLSTIALTVAPTLSNDRDRTVTIDRPVDAATVTAQVIDADDAAVGSPVTITGNTGTVTLGTADGSYRVVVTVADAAGNDAGVTSSAVTLDATAPDAGPAPTVTGDDRLRERTVAFTRDPSATLVFVEILDGDGDVVDTLPVPSGATASVTLPDADGDYGLRVRQFDDAGNADTTPTTDVILDRVAPDLSGLELTVTPEISNVAERTVTIVRPADAEIVIAQVIDENDQPVGSPVVIVGTTATVTLGSADRTYRVVVAVEDAAGNAAEVRSGGITLDTVAPDAGPAPTVTGGSSSPERTVTFRRDAGAVMVTIEVRNAAGVVVQTVPVPTGDSATIQLPDVGTYTIRVIQTDAAGNGQVTDETTIVRSPDPVPGPTPNPTPSPGPGPGPGPGGNGTPPAAPSCAKPALLLTDVRRAGNRARITGFTTRSNGTRVTIIETGGKQVGTATVDGSGAFSATVTPPRSASARDRVGYRASVEQERSPLVRLRQVNDLRTVARSADTVTLEGRVDVQRPSRFSAVEVYGGAGDCPTINKRLETVGKAKINRRTGTYTVQIRVPESERLVVKTRATIGGGNYHSTHTISAGR